MYKISLGYCGPTDCCLKVNDKEYLIESKAWYILDIIFDIVEREPNSISDILIQRLLKTIYNNFDEDLKESKDNT